MMPTKEERLQMMAVRRRQRERADKQVEMLSQQPSLFAPLPVEVEYDGKNGTIQERFEVFDRANPHIYRALTDIMFDMLRAGAKRWGVRDAYGILRYQNRHTIVEGREPYKLSNDFTSRYARKMLSEFPQLEGFIITSELKSR